MAAALRQDLGLKMPFNNNNNSYSHIENRGWFYSIYFKKHKFPQNPLWLVILSIMLRK